MEGLAKGVGYTLIGLGIVALIGFSFIKGYEFFKKNEVVPQTPLKIEPK